MTGGGCRAPCRPTAGCVPRSVSGRQNPERHLHERGSPSGEHAPGPRVSLVTPTLSPVPANGVAASLSACLPLVRVVSPWGVQRPCTQSEGCESWPVSSSSLN